MQADSISLFYREGSSDKVYQATLSQEGDGWVVDFQYGRRGKPLTAGRKTASPVPYDKARKVYDQLVASKTSKGYTPDESGIAYAGTDKAGAVTGFVPQLLNPISEEEIEEMVVAGNTIIALQIKHDGERRGALIQGADIVASNRRGLQTGLAQNIHDALLALEPLGVTDTCLDGEDMGDHLVVFDLLSWSGKDRRDEPFVTRANHLRALGQAVIEAGVEDIIRIEHPFMPADANEVRAFIARHRAANEEGIVVRDGLAKYVPGRPASGGGARKLKFVESATVRIAAVSPTKRSVTMELFDGQTWLDVGNCTIPANHEIPVPGALAEVGYLYAYPQGALFQPVYKGLRGDLDETAAATSQLKYKPV